MLRRGGLAVYLAGVLASSGCHPVGDGCWDSTRLIVFVAFPELKAGLVTTEGACTTVSCTQVPSSGVGCSVWQGEMTGEVGSTCSVLLTVEHPVTAEPVELSETAELRLDPCEENRMETVVHFDQHPDEVF